MGASLWQGSHFQTRMAIRRHPAGRTRTRGLCGLMRLDAAGNRIWDQTYTGLTSVAWPRLCATRDGGIMMAAQQGAPTEPQEQDLTLIKLSADALTAPQLRLPMMNAGASGFRFQLSGISNRTYVTEL